MISDLRNLFYVSCLDDFNLSNLEERRVRSDATQAFRIIKGFNSLDLSRHWKLDQFIFTRRNGCELVGKRFTSNEEKNFFFSFTLLLTYGMIYQHE